VWSDIPNNRMMRLLEDDGYVRVFRTPSQHASGNMRDRGEPIPRCRRRTREPPSFAPEGTALLKRGSALRYAPGSLPIDAANNSTLRAVHPWSRDRSRQAGPTTKVVVEA
jgi:hypothetical protein